MGSGDKETRKLLPPLPTPHSPFPTPYSPLRPATTSALIAAMRTAKLIITALLALQLFVTTGLCGGVCCATEPDRMDHGGLAVKENYKPATEEKIESGHCPLHAAQEAKPNPQERKRITHPQAASHRRHHQTRSSSTVDAHFCACDVKREERLSDALVQRSPEKRPAVQNPPGASNPARWLVESSPSQITSPDPSRSHSPPFRGRQLHLRI